MTWLTGRTLWLVVRSAATTTAPRAVLDESSTAGSAQACAGAAASGPTHCHLAFHGASTRDDGQDHAPEGGRRLAAPQSDMGPLARNSESMQVEHDSRHGPSLDQDGTAPTAVLQNDLPLRGPSPQHSASARYGHLGDAVLVQSKRRHRSLDERQARRAQGKPKSTVDDSEAARVFSRPVAGIVFDPPDLNRQRE